MTSSSHALLSVFRHHGIDRVFLVPGESYLGILDALYDFPGIDAVTCRHESGAGFMAVADARLTGRPGIALVSRGPGATNASIAVHTAQQDAIPLILIVGQVPRADLRREAFQEIDYRRMYGTIAKWVFEATDPGSACRSRVQGDPRCHLGHAGAGGAGDSGGYAAAASGAAAMARAEHSSNRPDAATLLELLRRIEAAERPLIVAGGGFEAAGRARGARRPGRSVADSGRAIVPAPRSFFQPAPALRRRTGVGESAAPDRRVSPKRPYPRAGHPLWGRHQPGIQFSRPAVAGADLRACLRRRAYGRASFRAGFRSGVRSDRTLRAPDPRGKTGARAVPWRVAAAPQGNFRSLAAWPQRQAADGIDFAKVIRSVREQASADAIVCVDAGHLCRPGLPPFRLRAAAAAHCRRFRAPWATARLQPSRRNCAFPGAR